jgi:hypothetical protein
MSRIASVFTYKCLPITVTEAFDLISTQVVFHDGRNAARILLTNARLIVKPQGLMENGDVKSRSAGQAC